VLAADDRVDKLTPEHRTWLEEEVVYIITDKERDAFLSLASIEERARFIDAFWLRRDPDVNTPVNEFKEEHYRRFEYANENFVRQTKRPGWQTDQGRVYNILGEPREGEGPGRREPEDEGAPQPFEVLEQQDRVQLVRDAIAALPETQRMALVLAKYHEMPYVEIARVMDSSEKAIKSLMHRARESLRQRLAGLLKEEPA